MKIYIYSLIVLCLVLSGHILGLHGFYVRYSTFDILMHIGGGIGIGLFVLAFIGSNFPRIRHRSIIIFISVLIFGILWESLEIYYNIAGHPAWTKLYYIDTTKDLVDDMIGGGLVIWCNRKSLRS